MIASLLMSLTFFAAPAPPPPGYAFVTTDFHDAILSAWPQAGGNSGLAASDAVCRAQATAASLSDASNYVAFLSDSNNDAYCRLHNLSGKKSANCGQASLPAFAGPWIRPDGIPFATLQTLNVDGAIISPAFLTAAGTHTASIMFSGTQAGLVADAFTPSQCNGWTTDPTTGVAAFFDGSMQVFGDSTGCSNELHLLCMHAGMNQQLNYAQRSGRQAFVTASTGGHGDLSAWAEAGGKTGIAAGDQICQTEAAANGLRAPTSFKAWLSDSSAVSPVNAMDRLQNDGPWVRTDGLPIAPSKAGLATFSQQQSLPIMIGQILVSGSGMVTGTNNDGTAAGADCHGWTSAVHGDSFVEGAGYFVSDWSNVFNEPCDSNSLQLYCFSDLDRLFDSGMEPIPY